MNEPQDGERSTSPHKATQAQGRSLIAALLYLLGGVFIVGSGLIWTIDEQAGAGSRGALMFGLAAVAFGLAATISWLSRRAMRARLVPRATLPSSQTSWRRTGMGAPWTDWLAPLIPLVLVGLPSVFIADPLDAEFAAKMAVLVGFLELFILPFFLIARREFVALELTVDGLVLTQRRGKTRHLPRASVARIDLQTRHNRGFAFHELVIHLAPGLTSRRLTVREPMTAPLPDIAQRLDAHLADRG